MFCRKCGSEIKNGEKFCGKCGMTVLPNASSNKRIIFMITVIVIALFSVTILITNIMHAQNDDYFVKKHDDQNEDIQGQDSDSKIKGISLSTYNEGLKLMDEANALTSQRVLDEFLDDVRADVKDLKSVREIKNILTLSYVDDKLKKRCEVIPSMGMTETEMKFGAVVLDYCYLKRSSLLYEAVENARNDLVSSNTLLYVLKMILPSSESIKQKLDAIHGDILMAKNQEDLERIISQMDKLN